MFYIFPSDFMGAKNQVMRGEFPINDPTWEKSKKDEKRDMKRQEEEEATGLKNDIKK